MVTDGVSDSAANPTGKDDWVAGALQQVDVAGPEVLAEYLLNMAKVHQKDIIKDDMTVIVLQVVER
jgi:serine phosphatase RsbU (regulator of sigma subunit)